MAPRSSCLLAIVDQRDRRTRAMAIALREPSALAVMAIAMLHDGTTGAMAITAHKPEARRDDHRAV